MFYRSTLLVAALLLARAVAAQAPSSAPSSVGVWRGTSLCRVKPSSCKDEVVVYRITPMKSSDSVSLDARKIVNGQEEDMGLLTCRVLLQGTRIVCGIPRGTWQFTVRGDSLTGELRLADGTKFRDVRTARSR